MSAGNGAARPVVARLHPVDVDRGRVDVRATLPPDIVKRAEALADGGAVALRVAGALLAGGAAARPEPVGGCGPARIRRAGGRHGGRPGGCGLWRGRNERRGRLERRGVYCGASRPLAATHPLRTAPRKNLGLVGPQSCGPTSAPGPGKGATGPRFEIPPIDSVFPSVAARSSRIQDNGRKRRSCSPS